MSVEVWIPEKRKIEDLLRIAADKVKDSERISDIEDWLQDELSMLDCHITNRANVERGIIKLD